MFQFIHTAPFIDCIVKSYSMYAYCSLISFSRPYTCSSLSLAYHLLDKWSIAFTHKHNEFLNDNSFGIQASFFIIIMQEDFKVPTDLGIFIEYFWKKHFIFKFNVTLHENNIFHLSLNLLA